MQSFKCSHSFFPWIPRADTAKFYHFLVYWPTFMFMNTTTYFEDCRPLLFNISSNGIWENLKSPDVIFGYSLPLMEIQILLIFTSVVMTHMFLRCIGISHIGSYMIVSIPNFNPSTFYYSPWFIFPLRFLSCFVTRISYYS